jgi:hypothetical protein
MGKNDDIERLFREKFEGYRLRPSEGLWGRVVRQLRLREFLRFSPGQFNVWYLAGVLAVALTAYLVLHPSGSRPEGNTPAPVMVRQPQENLPAVAPEKKQPASAEGRPVSVERKDEGPARKEAHPRGKNNMDVPARGTVASEKGQTPPASEKGHEKEEGAAAVSPGKKGGDRGEETPERSLQKEQPAPVARFEMSVKKGCPPLKVRFINRSQHASAYSWSLEPAGITFASENPEYLFEVPGTYIVRLTAQDGEGRTSVHTDTVEVLIRPRARFDYSPKDAVVPDEAIYGKVRLKGRFEKVAPNVVLDVGHNPLGAQAVAEALDGKKRILVYNALNDKDVEEILKILEPVVARVEIIPIESERAMDPERLRRVARRIGLDVGTFRRIDPAENYLVFGSFVVAEAFLKRLGHPREA